MNIRQLLKRDHGIDVRISAGIGRRDDPYVLDKCDVEEAALTMLQLLRGLGRGLDELWRIIEWTPSGVDATTEVIRIEVVRFTETEIETTTRGVYFDTSAVSGAPHTLHPLISWQGSSGVPALPFELGWLHFDQVFNNAASDGLFDQTILFSGAGAKASVYVYTRSSGNGGETRDAELERAAAVVLTAGLQDPWPVIEVGPFAVKCFLSRTDMTLVGVALCGPYFVKVRLTYFDDLKMREMMNASLMALGACVTCARENKISFRDAAMNTATPNCRFTSVTADLLAAEFEEWFRNLATCEGVAPRAFTGVARNGQQVVVILNDIPWTRPAHIQRRAFINWLCRKENITAYAVATMMVLKDNSCELDIVADDGNNIVLTLLPIVALANGNLTYGEAKVHRWKAGDQWHPYSGLMIPDSISETPAEPGDEVFFDGVWGEMRPKAFWRERPRG
ncbi:MAG TPA: hypothetical protein PLD73_18680 [Candidatus Hydrogenedentes bacterium]|nr:hypothetical protein [Candidatus Hydrogenedentota bacterium]